VISGFEDFKQAIVYEDYIDENGKIKYGISKKVLRPYFYVLEESFVPDDKCIVNVEPGYVGICGERLKKIVTRLPTDVSYIRNSFGRTFEADILYPWRARIDNGYVVKDNVRLFLDIEVAMGSRFDKSSYRYPIICVSLYDTKSKDYIVFTWRGDLDRAELVEKRLERIRRGKDENHKEMSYRIHTFSNEKDMLLAMCKYIVVVNPDVMTAWNTSFDYPYIINRMHSLQMNPGMLSPINFVGIDKFDGEAIIKGRYVLDLLQAYKKIHIGQLESFKLDDVGIFELEVPKIKLDDSFEDLWKKDINKLVEYNVADLELCVRLDEKKKIMDFFEGIANFTGVPLDETLARYRLP
jgi:DNA polymerase elongation subunit (family B)